MADVTVANTSPGIAGKTLACHDADGVTTGIWTLANPLALKSGVSGTQTWRLSVAGSGNLQVLADGTGAGLSLNTAGDLFEKSRTTPLGHWIDVAADNSYFAMGGPANGNWGFGALDAFAYMLVGKTLLLSVGTHGGTWFISSDQINVKLPMGAIARHVCSGTAVFASSSVSGYQLCFAVAGPSPPWPSASWINIVRPNGVSFPVDSNVQVFLQLAIAIV